MDKEKFESCDGIFTYFVYALCYFKENGVLDLEFPQAQFSSYAELQAFAKLCMVLMIDGTASPYFEFLIDLEYQRILSRNQGDEKLLTELYVIRYLVALLRTHNVLWMNDLIRNHCSPGVREPLLEEIWRVFGNDLPGNL
jgi:hypothetical protein